MKGLENSTGKVPTWMTWYEQEDIEELYKEILSQHPKPLTRAATHTVVSDLLKRHAVKDLRVSLSSSRFKKVLRQFTFPGIQMGHLANFKPSTGTIYYSPSYVRHLLENAHNIAGCPINFPPQIFPQWHATIPNADPKDIYALCMDSEMPRSAVMIKVTWKQWDDQQGSHKPPMGGGFDHGANDEITKDLTSPPPGTWVPGAALYPLGGTFRVVDENHQVWALMGMHIASKRLRTWMWTSVWWGSGDAKRGGWSADAPKTFGVFELGFPYEMCTVSDFKESDATPWSAYEQKAKELYSQASATGDAQIGYQADKYDALAKALKAIAKVMKGTQWCANPFIESTMSQGNCIGCHQGSTESLLPTTLSKVRQINISDFSFSFATNRAMIQSVMKQHAAQGK